MPYYFPDAKTAPTKNQSPMGNPSPHFGREYLGDRRVGFMLTGAASYLHADTNSNGSPHSDSGADQGV